MVNQVKDVKESSLQDVYSKTTITRLNVEEVKECMEHIKAVWEEVDQRNKDMVLDPDYDLYQELHTKGCWFFYKAVHEGDTSLYSFFIQPSLHVKGTKQMVSDFIYVNPKHRGTGVADILLLSAEAQAKELGVSISIINLKDFQKHSSLVQRLGYTLYENSFQKVTKWQQQL